MANRHLLERLTGIQRQLIASHATGKSMSSSSKGRERETFINDFMKAVLPPIYRFGTGDATDVNGHRSGQLDVVIEYPFGPSLPAVGSGDVRLYLAETVAAVIEVKSNLSSQWDEVAGTASKVEPLTRGRLASLVMGAEPSPKIPVIAVGYEGWKTTEPVLERLRNSSVAAALIIEPGIFVSSHRFGSVEASGPAHALWAMICFLHHHISGLQMAQTNPIRYVI